MKTLSPSQAAAYCGISRSCLFRWWRMGRIERYLDPDGRAVYRLADLDTLILSRPKRGRKPRNRA